MPKQFTTAILYCTFLLTGICVSTPGALLPQLLPLWGMNDVGGGLLLFGFFAGSSLGALAARGSLKHAVLGGCTLCSISGLGITGQWQSLHIPFMTIFGLGLGLCMTSISLQRSRTQALSRVAELTRLNTIWAAGALAGPSACIHLSRQLGPINVFAAIALTFLAIGLCVAASRREYWSPPAISIENHNRTSSWVITTLLIMIPLATGLESSVGGWLVTYVSRGRAGLVGGEHAVTFFWGGFLIGRLVHSHQRVARRVSFALRTYPSVSIAGLLLLAWNSNLWLLYGGALLVGWSIATLYPITLALLLDQTELGNLGFLIAGVGSAFLPLIMGLISNATHTLRAGIIFLLLPASGLAVLGKTVSSQKLMNLENQPASKGCGNSS